MKDSQVYFIHQAQIQYYDFNNITNFFSKIYSVGFDKLLKY